MIVTRIVDRLTEPLARMMQPPPSMHFDFLHPKGEPALFGPDSVSWRIFKNPVSVFIGGVAAVILELAEPSVRSGVWDHTSFRKDAVMRLRRTGAAAMMTVYGPAEAAEEMIERVVRIHDQIHGTTPSGLPYKANDQRLLDWVQATASYGFVEAYSRFVHGLTEPERSQAFAEGAVAARLYGAVGAPRSYAEWNALLARTRPTLERSATVFEFLDIMNTTPLVPRPLRSMQRLMVRAAVDVVPDDIRLMLGLEHAGLALLQRRLVKLAGQISDRVPIRAAPPAQASIRVGRGPTFLYRLASASHQTQRIAGC
jgi:uncharacterized protein (DUF2236 family)